METCGPRGVFGWPHHRRFPAGKRGTVSFLSVKGVVMFEAPPVLPFACTVMETREFAAKPARGDKAATSGGHRVVVNTCIGPIGGPVTQDLYLQAKALEVQHDSKGVVRCKLRFAPTGANGFVNNKYEIDIVSIDPPPRAPSASAADVGRRSPAT